MIFPRIPGTLFLKGAVAVLYTVAIYGLGNLHATERVMKEQEQIMLQDSANRERENHLVWFAALKEEREKWRSEFAQQQAAAQKAFTDLEKSKRTAEANLRTARAALAKALETPNVIVTPATIPPSDPGCIMPPGVRQTINNYIASINSAPAIGNPISTTTGLPIEPPASNSVLSCRELATSVIDILNHDAAMIAEIMSWRSWANEALK